MNIKPEQESLSMRVLFLCGREPDYVRNRVILRALRASFHVTALVDSSPDYLRRHLRLFARLLITASRYDAVVVGFYGYFLLPLVRLRLPGLPVIFDAYLSNYDTLCIDRQRFAPDSLMGRLAFSLDRTARLARQVILDTHAHADYFSNTFRLPREQVTVLYVGAEESVFHPLPQQPGTDTFTVLYYGSFLPLQGIDVVVRAAKLLECDTCIRFVIIGQGMESARIARLAADLDVRNIVFRPPVPYTDLPQYIAQSNVCLGGHFSAIPKAGRVIASKTYQMLAMARPTIVSDTPANRELFTQRRDVLMCPPADPQALAAAIRELRDDPALRTAIAQEGYTTFHTHCGDEATRRMVKAIILEAVTDPGVPS